LLTVSQSVVYIVNKDDGDICYKNNTVQLCWVRNWQWQDSVQSDSDCTSCQ